MIDYVAELPELPHSCIRVSNREKLREHLAEAKMTVPLDIAAKLLHAFPVELVEAMIGAGWLIKSDRTGQLALVEEVGAQFLALTPFIFTVGGVPRYGESLNVNGAGLLELADVLGVRVSDFYSPCHGCLGDCDSFTAPGAWDDHLVNVQPLA